MVGIFAGKLGVMRMTEQERLVELANYQLMNTPPEKEYNYIVELAAAICDTPISLINLVGEKQTWFKAKLGLEEDICGTPRNVSVCDHTIGNPHEVLIIPDLRADKRFSKNPLVTGDPFIRFYAGSPLVSPSGHVMGALCVIDHEPKQLTDTQIKGLNTLAQKVVDVMELKKASLRRKVERDYLKDLLHKVSGRAPGALYKLKIKNDGTMLIPFCSDGISMINPRLSAKKVMNDPELMFMYIHPDDREEVKKSLNRSRLELSKWDVEYRVILPDNIERWYKAEAVPEKWEDGTVVWYGTIQDVTKMKEYILTIEQHNHALFEMAWAQTNSVRVKLAQIISMLGTINTFEMDETNKELLTYVQSSMNELDCDIEAIVERSSNLGPQ